MGEEAKNIASLAFGPSTRDTGRGALILRARCLCWARPRLVSPLESPFRAQWWCCTAASWAALLQCAAPAAHAGTDAYAFADFCLRPCLAHSTGARSRFTATLPALPAAEVGYRALSHCQRRRWPLRAGCCGTALHAGALAALALLRARPTQLQLRAGHRRSSTSRSSGLSLFIARSLQPPARPPWWPNGRQGSGCDSPWRHGGVTTSSEGSRRRRAHLTGSTAARGAEPSPRAHPLPREHHRPASLPTRPHPACRDPPRALLARGQAAPGGTTSRRSFSH